MPTPAYGLKHWWRSERRPGESLKAFARRWAPSFRVSDDDACPHRFAIRRDTTTSELWLHRKGSARPAAQPMPFDSFRDALVMIAIMHNEELRLAGADMGLN